jgi:hypothetical protein
VIQTVSIKRNIIRKITKQKRAGGIGQVVEHLSSDHEALNSNPSTAKNVVNLFFFFRNPATHCTVLPKNSAK